MEKFKHYVNFELNEGPYQTVQQGKSDFDARILPHLDDIMGGDATLRFLIPASALEQPAHKNVNADYFVGLVEPLLIALQEEFFPDLVHKTRQSGLMAVPKIPDIKTISDHLTDIFQTAYEAYDPIEQLFWKNVRIGVYDQDGVRTAPLTENRFFTFPEAKSEEESTKLFLWANELCTAVEACFLANLDASSFADVPEEQDTPSRMPSNS